LKSTSTSRPLAVPFLGFAATVRKISGPDRKINAGIHNKELYPFAVYGANPPQVAAGNSGFVHGRLL
jgi:hypothetical protein